MKAGKNEYPVKFGIVDMDEIPVDSSMFVLTEDKKLPDETKPVLKQEKTNNIQLF